jgi:hypothetical protein
VAGIEEEVVSLYRVKSDLNIWDIFAGVLEWWSNGVLERKE